MTEFKANSTFLQAQAHENNSNRNFIVHNFIKLKEYIDKTKKQNDVTLFEATQEINNFFNGDKQKFIDFINSIKTKQNLEIGSGPCGILASWVWLENRIIIDSLLKTYRDTQLELFNETWYTDEIRLISQPAEVFVEDLNNKIDGMIFFRNALDHCQDWKLVLENISKYARSGCSFLFWSDLSHGGNGDSGHFEITSDLQFFKNYLKNLGFDINYEFQYNRSGDLDFGCFATKI